MFECVYVSVYVHVHVLAGVRKREVFGLLERDWGVYLPEAVVSRLTSAPASKVLHCGLFWSSPSVWQCTVFLTMLCGACNYSYPYAQGK